MALAKKKASSKKPAAEKKQVKIEKKNDDPVVETAGLKKFDKFKK